MKKKLTLVIITYMIAILVCSCGKEEKDKIHTPFFTDEPNSVSSNLEYSYVSFGNYPQKKITDISDDIVNALYDDNDNATVSGKKIKRIKRNNGYEYYEIEPIVWKVIEVDGDEAVLITDKIIDCQAYNEDGGMVKWEDSTVRLYLNNEFLNNAFDKKERKNIVESTVKNYSSNFGYPMTEAGYPDKVYKETKDYVYLTSLYETDTYVFNNPYAKDGNVEKYAIYDTNFYNADASDYALDIFNENLPDNYSKLNQIADKCIWMLRTYIENTEYICTVDFDNSIDSVGISDENTFTTKSDDVLGIRPKIRVKTKGLKIVKE